MSYQAESSLVLYDNQIISATRGSPAAVEFDFEAVWAFKKTKGSDFQASSLLWLHVHPPGFGTQASGQDRKCVQALRAAFGPQIGEFGILCFDNDNVGDPSGEIAWYAYSDKSLIRLQSKRIQGDDFIDNLGLLAIILKTISYVPIPDGKTPLLNLLRRSRDAMGFDQFPEPEQLRDMMGIIREIDVILGDRSEFHKGWDRMVEKMKEVVEKLK